MRADAPTEDCGWPAPALDDATFSMFRDTGRDIFLRGLASSHAGNMSIRRGRHIFITKRASMLGRLKEGDIVQVGWDPDDAVLSIASSEFIVHKAIYGHTNALAVVHAHPPYATLLSLTRDELVPVDSEGSHFFERVPVVSPEKTIASGEVARAVSECLKKHKIVIVRGHGSFARGDNLEEAHMFTSSLEASAFFLYHTGKIL